MWSIEGLPENIDFTIQVFSVLAKHLDKVYFPKPFNNKCLAIIFGDTTTGTLYKQGYNPYKTTAEYFTYMSESTTSNEGSIALAIGY